MELTAQCLITNPKSYGAWHHRCYSLDQMAAPDWDRELALCAKFLSMDERNFHCWDYRSIAAGRARRSAEAEVGFTLEMITANFSNYSAWHYRSKLLGQAGAGHAQELDLVQNAAFTDPEDSSAWLYHTWLLGGCTGRPAPRLLCLGAGAGAGQLRVAASCHVAADQIHVAGAAVSWEEGPRFR